MAVIKQCIFVVCASICSLHDGFSSFHFMWSRSKIQNLVSFCALLWRRGQLYGLTEHAECCFFFFSSPLMMSSNGPSHIDISSFCNWQLHLIRGASNSESEGLALSLSPFSVTGMFPFLHALSSILCVPSPQSGKNLGGLLVPEMEVGICGRVSWAAFKANLKVASGPISADSWLSDLYGCPW